MEINPSAKVLALEQSPASEDGTNYAERKNSFRTFNCDMARNVSVYLHPERKSEKENVGTYKDNGDEQ